VLAWVTAVIVVGLNGKLVIDFLSDWIGGAGEGAFWIWTTVVPAVVALGVLLVYISLPASWRRGKEVREEKKKVDIVPETYRKIGVAVDYTELEQKVLSHAKTLATHHGAELFIFHVVEGVSGQLYGTEALDEEAREDREKLEQIAADLRSAGLRVTPLLGFGRVAREIVRLSRETGIDILVMGGHRHRGVKDLLLGTSISEVRHALPIPVMIIQ